MRRSYELRVLDRMSFELVERLGQEITVIGEYQVTDADEAFKLFAELNSKGGRRERALRRLRQMDKERDITIADVKFQYCSEGIYDVIVEGYSGTVIARPEHGEGIYKLLHSFIPAPVGTLEAIAWRVGKGYRSWEERVEKAAPGVDRERIVRESPWPSNPWKRR